MHMPRLSALVLLLALLATASLADVVAGRPVAMNTLAPVDRVVVHKAARRMELYRGEEQVTSYRISLGLSPSGPKQREGDFRTPEGRYRLTRRHARSEFFLAVQVSYPDASDQAAARRNGWSPGGQIMVHGLPNVARYSRSYYLNTDWTNGCIALSNEDMLEFWLLTGHDTLIEILP